MTDLQRIEFQMLEQFVAICEKLNLRYYLPGGTLIGAVRHHGFIPWDDDIDVGMPRNDYEFFCSQHRTYCQSHISYKHMRRILNIQISLLKSEIRILRLLKQAYARRR